MLNFFLVAHLTYENHWGKWHSKIRTFGFFGTPYCTCKRFIQILWSLQRVIQFASSNQYRDCKILANLRNGVKHYIWRIFRQKKCVALLALTNSNHQARCVLYIHSLVAKRCTGATRRDYMFSFMHIAGRWAKGQVDLEWIEGELGAERCRSLTRATWGDLYGLSNIEVITLKHLKLGHQGEEVKKLEGRECGYMSCEWEMHETAAQWGDILARRSLRNSIICCQLGCLSNQKLFCTQSVLILNTLILTIMSFSKLYLCE